MQAVKKKSIYQSNFSLWESGQLKKKIFQKKKMHNHVARQKNCPIPGWNYGFRYHEKNDNKFPPNISFGLIDWTTSIILLEGIYFMSQVFPDVD